MISQPIYRLRASEVYGALETSPQGLSAAQVTERLSLYGKKRHSRTTAAAMVE